MARDIRYAGASMGVLLPRMVGEGFPGKVSPEQEPERSEGAAMYSPEGMYSRQRKSKSQGKFTLNNFLSSLLGHQFHF